jgi:propanol-preferring alcohol dehydrogenase
MSARSRPEPPVTSRYPAAKRHTPALEFLCSADEGLLSGDEAVKRIKDLTRGQGANLVLDMVGVNPTLQMAAQVARVLGHVTIVGLGGGALPVNFFSPPHECSVASPTGGSSPS